MVVIVVSPVIGHGIPNRGASKGADHRADRPSDNRANGRAADAARKRAGFVGLSKRG
jgi:hypothetical protein